MKKVNGLFDYLVVLSMLKLVILISLFLYSTVVFLKFGHRKFPSCNTTVLLRAELCCDEFTVGRELQSYAQQFVNNL